MHYIHLLVAIICVLLASRGEAQKKLSLTDSVPLNPKVRHGVLENGLTYYVLRNKDTNNSKIVLRLVEKVGAYHAQDGELGAAHLIEHLSLRSTKKFPEGVMKFMIGLGLTYGEITAKTGVFTTNYELRIPDGDPNLLQYGLLALHDWAKGRLYRPEEVEEERAAVLNEFAMADAKRIQKTYLLLDKNPLYASRLAEEIQNYQKVSTETLRRFDCKWYRPDLQAVIVVGDMDEIEMEKEIKAIFSTLENEADDEAPSAGMYKQYDVVLTGSNKLVVTNDGTERTRAHIEILQKRKTIMGMDGACTFNQMRVQLMDELYNELVRQRLNGAKAGSQTVVAHLSHFVDRRAIAGLAGIDALTTMIEVSDLTEVKAAIVFAIKELRRIERWGFTDNEFALAKEAVLKNKQRALQTPTSQSMVLALASHFVDQAAFAENPLELNTRLLNDISLNEINASARDWIKEDGNTDVLFLVPNEEDPGIPDEKEVFSWIRGAMNAKVKPYVESELKSLPTPPGDVSHDFTRSELAEIGATQLVLSNGVKVVIKRLGSVSENPWPDLGDINLNGFREGGTNLYGDRDYPSACVAIDLIRASGIASLNESQLNAWLKDKRRNGELSVSPYILYSEEGIQGQSALNNAHNFFHLVYLYFTEPGKDKAVFNEKFKPNYNKPERPKSNREVFMDSIQSVITGNVARKATGTPKFSKAYRIYQERFSNAHNFTFVIMGYFETDDMIELAVRYLGALPAVTNGVKRSASKYKTQEPLSLSTTNNDLRVTLIGDSTGNADVKMVFRGKLEATVRNKLLIRLTGSALKLLLHDRLREQEKGVYWVIVGGGFLGNSDEFILEVKFPTAPEKVDRLTAAVIDELNKIAKGNLEDNFFNSALTTIRSRISNDLRNIYYLNSYITDQLKKGTLSANGLKREQILNSLTKHDVIDLVRNYLNTEHYILFKIL